MAQPDAPPEIIQLDLNKARKERLKKAGELYFERILQQTGSDQPKAPIFTSSGTIFLPLTTHDDLETVGLIVESARPAVFGTLYVTSQALSLVYLKASLTAIETPALLAAFHFMPIAFTMILLSLQNIVTLTRISSNSLKGAVPSAALELVQAFLLYSALMRSTVFLTLCWVALTPWMVQSAVQLFLEDNTNKPSNYKLLAHAMGASALITVSFVEGVDAVTVWLFVLWGTAQGASAVWSLLQKNFELAPTLLTPAGAALLGPCLEAEQSLDPPSLLYLKNLIAIFPALLFGLISGEFSDLMESELSVPSAGTLLVSMTSWTVASVSGIFMRQTPPLVMGVLQGASPLGTILTEVAVHGLTSGIGFLCALIAAVVGLTIRLL